MKKNTERINKILGSMSAMLKHIPLDSSGYVTAEGQNCENIIGTVSLPLGVAGPLLIDGREFVLPLATTEGCLVASINRGCKAIYRSGGARSLVKKVGITRAPVFGLESLDDGERCQNWLRENLSLMQDKVGKLSKFTKLLGIDCQQVGRFLHVKFTFDTADAMGMNMAVRACDHIVRTMIEPELKIKCLALSGNFCSDKKQSAVNTATGRGFCVNAEVEIGAEILSEVLKTDAYSLQSTYIAKIGSGSFLAGSMGRNSHAANMIAALFIATGQDPAQVVNMANSITMLEVNSDGSVLFSVYLPEVVCGVLGGGTHLPKQAEALKLIGVDPDPLQPGVANLQFAKVIAGTVLAGELSLLCALASGDFEKAHISLFHEND